MVRLTRKEMSIPTDGDDLADFQQFVASGKHRAVIFIFTVIVTVVVIVTVIVVFVVFSRSAWRRPCRLPAVASSKGMPLLRILSLSVLRASACA
jgi:heme/copper-type cytochrome/quinol oxidase subunit 2